MCEPPDTKELARRLQHALLFKWQEDLSHDDGMPVLGEEKTMGESIRWRMTRKNLVVDGGLCRAIEMLYYLYYIYLKDHPGLAVLLEDLMYQITDCRVKLRQFHVRCWESDPPQFDSISEMGKLIIEARADVLGRDAQCRGYSLALEALRVASSPE